MTFNEMIKVVLEIFPNASIEEDNNGQLVIYTNLRLTANDDVIEFDPEA
jgi:hypothetical protein